MARPAAMLKTICAKSVWTVVLASGFLAFAVPAWPASEPEQPKDVGLFEHAERRLFPLTVRIRATAPQYRSKAAHLTKEDFSVMFDLETLPPSQFELDNFCPDSDADRPPESPEPPESLKHLLFVVDPMGLEGQDNTNAMLRNIIPRMAEAGYQMKILPGGVSEWTGDADQLLRDVSRLFDPSSPSPETIGEPAEDRVRALLERNRVDEAIAVAQQAEAAAQRTLEGPALKLELLISEMAALPMPKAMMYFADSGYFARERILEAAIRSGVAIYAVKANGMSEFDPHVRLADDEGAAATVALLSLSEHSGGRFSYGHFKKSASDTIVRRVETGLSCVYVLNIDAAALDRDRTLRPKVRLRPELRGQVRAETIPDFAIPNDKRQQEEAASLALRSGQGPGVQQAGVSLVPIGFNGSRVIALIQFALGFEPGAPSIPETWDMGVNYFGSARVSGYGNVRVTSRPPRTVFDKVVSLPVGPYAIVGVAQEVAGHGLARGASVGTLEKPDNDAVGFVHGLDIMQRAPGTFVADHGVSHMEEWSALRYGMANSDRPISLVVSMCRGKGVQEPLTIEKSLLLPDKELRFSRTDWPPSDNFRCVVVKDDLLASDQLPWSNQPYEPTFVVTVKTPSGTTLATHRRAFWIIGPTR
jgi:hypothetical protein